MKRIKAVAAVVLSASLVSCGGMEPAQDAGVESAVQGECPAIDCGTCDMCACADIQSQIDDLKDDLNTINGTIMNLQMGIGYMTEKMNELTQANNDLLGLTDNYGATITGYVGLAVVDAYSVSKVVKGAQCAYQAGSFAAKSCVAGAATQKEALYYWWTNGGSKSLGDIGVGLMLKGACGTITSGSSWTKYIPIWGPAEAAYNWSTKCFGAADIIEENGKGIRIIQAEIAKAKALVDTYTQKAKDTQAKIDDLQKQLQTCQSNVMQCEMKIEMTCMGGNGGSGGMSGMGGMGGMH